MASKNEISLDDIPYVLSAFGNSRILTDKLERFVIKNFLRLTPK